MPIYEIDCPDCGFSGEALSLSATESPECPSCGKTRTEKRMSATSSLTGREGAGLPGPGDHGCCGATPGHAGCAGPGSCCGKNVG